MKILSVSDLHASTAWQTWILENLQGIDLLCLPGDILDNCYTSNQLLDQALQFEQWLNLVTKAEVAVALCSGNHDDISFIEASAVLDVPDGGLVERARQFIQIPIWTDTLSLVDPVPVITDAVTSSSSRTPENRY